VKTYCRVLPFIWKWCFCRWLHNKYRCFPEVWDRGLDGPWHCSKCHPCSEGLVQFLNQFETNEEANNVVEEDDIIDRDIKVGK